MRTLVERVGRDRHNAARSLEGKEVKEHVCRHRSHRRSAGKRGSIALWLDETGGSLGYLGEATPCLLGGIS